MQCPVCEVPLSISSREGIEIDFCPQCRGVWLDRGELDKIIERAAVAMAPAGPARYDDPRYEDPRSEDRRYEDRRRGYGHDDDWHHGKKRKRRGSFLEDLFDFD